MTDIAPEGSTLDDGEHTDRLSDLAGEELTVSRRGVIFLGADDQVDRITLSIPAAMLTGLFQSFADDDTPSATAQAVSDLFDGDSGDLEFLRIIGCAQ